MQEPTTQPKYANQRCECSNCGHVAHYTVPADRPVPTRADEPSEIACIECGCNELFAV
jgi:hypothetical protein